MLWTINEHILKQEGESFDINESDFPYSSVDLISISQCLARENLYISRERWFDIVVIASIDSSAFENNEFFRRFAPDWERVGPLQGLLSEREREKTSQTMSCKTVRSAQKIA